MPNFRAWFESELGIDITYTTPSQPRMSDDCIADSCIDTEFVHRLREHRIAHSNRKQLRLNRAHGILKVVK